MAGDDTQGRTRLPGFAPAGAGHASSALQTVLGRLDELVDWERRERSAGSARLMRVDVEPARDLFERAGVAPNVPRVIHVAGTKGKGSVASLVGAALIRAGYSVGIFASPHVERVNERIRIQGECIADDELAIALERALELREEAIRAGSEGARATWFDVITTAALVAFQRAEVQWAVVECGLGGRLDSTNALHSELCVVTNVDLEHTAILGSTRAEIAAEKVGIVGPGTPLVTGVGRNLPLEDDEAGRVLIAHCRHMKSELIRASWPEGASIADRNASVAGKVLDALGEAGVTLRDPVAGAADPGSVGAHLLDEATILAARLPGRQELRTVNGTPVLLDGAHVASSLAELFSGPDLPPGPPVTVLGMGRDKPAATILKVLAGRVDRLICTSLGPGPYLDADELTAMARSLGLPAECRTPPGEALKRALEHAAGGGWVLITGSLHLVGAIRQNIAK